MFSPCYQRQKMAELGSAGVSKGDIPKSWTPYLMAAVSSRLNMTAYVWDRTAALLPKR